MPRTEKGSKTLLLPRADKWDLTQPENVRRLIEILEDMHRGQQTALNTVYNYITNNYTDSQVFRVQLTADIAATDAVSVAGVIGTEAITINLLPTGGAVTPLSDYLWTTADGTAPGDDDYVIVAQAQNDLYYLLDPQPVSIDAIRSLFACEA